MYKSAKVCLIVIAVFIALVLGAYQWQASRISINAPFMQLIYAYTGKTPAEEQVQQRLRVPQGFDVNLWVEGLPGARMLAVTASGNLLVSLPRQGKVVLIAIGDHGEALVPRDLLTGLDRPHGLAINQGWLYIAQASSVARVRVNDEGDLEPQGTVERILTGLPAGGNHWTRSLDIGPDGRLYITVGSSCNVCEEEDPRRAAMLVSNVDGTDVRVYANGLRNAVGFDWQPDTNALFATENGRDLLGENLPPCELNRIREGAFYGWPYANGNRVTDPDLGAGHEERIKTSVAPVHDFPAHSAPLGISFVLGDSLPAEYRGAALVALHGSWNRLEKSGYKVVSLHWQSDGSILSKDFLTGFEVNEDVIGRPVDIAEGSDGSIYVSDDFSGVIWRVTRSGTGSPQPVAKAENEPVDGIKDTAVAVEGNSAWMVKGAELFSTHRCGSCHLPQLAKPGVLVHPLVDLARRYDLATLSDFLATPTPPMPAFPLDEYERKALATYLLSEFREKPRELP